MIDGTRAATNRNNPYNDASETPTNTAASQSSTRQDKPVTFQINAVVP